MTRWCGVHRGDVRDTDAQIVSSTETGSGPGQPAYACIGCIRANGIVPLGARFIGRRDAPPAAPRESA